MINKPFIESFPQPLPRDGDSLFRQWVEAQQDSLNETADMVEQVAMTNRILEAEGEHLDLIGDQFGQIGERSGRGDEQYRSFLLSIVPSFQGRGTPTGLAFAVGSGVQARPDEIEVIEHFDDLEYSLVIGDWIGHEVTTIYDLADLADPSGVKLRTPVTYSYDRTGFGISLGEFNRDTAVTSPPISIGFNLHDTEVDITGGGFGVGYFDGEDPFGDQQLGQIVASTPGRLQSATGIPRTANERILYGDPAKTALGTTETLSSTESFTLTGGDWAEIIPVTASPIEASTTITTVPVADSGDVTDVDATSVQSTETETLQADTDSGSVTSVSSETTLYAGIGYGEDEFGDGPYGGGLSENVEYVTGYSDTGYGDGGYGGK